MTAEQEILSAYGENPNAIYSINEIAKRIGKAYPHVHKKVRGLIQKGVLKRYEVGRSHLCAVNLENTQAVLLLALNHAHKYEQLPKRVQQQALKLKQHNPDAIIYDETTHSLLLITEQPVPEADCLTTQELQERLINEEELYTNHTVIAGYEHIFTLLSTPEIARRYHPLL